MGKLITVESGDPTRTHTAITSPPVDARRTLSLVTISRPKANVGNRRSQRLFVCLFFFSRFSHLFLSFHLLLLGISPWNSAATRLNWREEGAQTNGHIVEMRSLLPTLSFCWLPPSLSQKEKQREEKQNKSCTQMSLKGRERERGERDSKRPGGRQLRSSTAETVNRAFRGDGGVFRSSSRFYVGSAIDLNGFFSPFIFCLLLSLARTAQFSVALSLPVFPVYVLCGPL